MEDSSAQEAQAGGYGELLTQVRRLTAIVLDMIEEGKMEKTMEDREKRLLVSSASKLFRFWRTTAKEAATLRALARSSSDDSERSMN